MNWTAISEIATTISAIISALSLFAAYRLYFASKKDEFVRNFRIALTESQFNCGKLNQIATHELLHEISYSVLYREDTKMMIDTVLKDIKKLPQENLNDKEFLKEFFKKNLPQITFPVQSRLVEEYNNKIEQTKSKITQYQISFPAVNMVTRTVLDIFKSILNINIQVVVNDDIWEDVFVNIFHNRTEELTTNEIQYKIHKILTGVLMKRFLEQRDQNDINDILNLIKIIANAYLKLSDDTLYKYSQLERNEKIRHSDELDTRTAIFIEAEKILRNVLTQQELLEYHGIVSAFGERNKKQS